MSAAQGIIYATSFSWTQSDAARAFGKRFMAMRGGQAPTMIQAGVYSAVKHYLEAIKAADTDDADAVAAAMRKLPVDDFMTDHARHPRGRPGDAQYVPGAGEVAGGIP